MRQTQSICIIGAFAASACLALCSNGVLSETILAENLSQAKVQQAVDRAANGDIVKLPAGTATWTKSVEVDNKYLTIMGAGIDKTVIAGGDYAPCTTQPSQRVFTITAKPGGLMRLTRLTIDGGTGARDDYNKGMIAVGGVSKTWRVDHVRIRATRNCAMQVYASGGVIDHCLFDLVGWTFGIYGFNGGTYGDPAWAEDAGIGGGDKPFFVEDNQFVATDRAFALDGWMGERVVFRHNVLKNAMIGNHGTETSGRLRGARSFEIYDNKIELAGPEFYTAIELRSGTGVIFNNSITGPVSHGIGVDNYRDAHAFAPWGVASGESPFDLNDVDKEGMPIVFDAGAHTGPAGARTLTCAGKTWKIDQWKGYSVHNSATGKSSMIVGNTGDTLVTKLDDSRGDLNIAWQPGDAFRIERCLVALDQMGRGKGKLISGDAPTPAAWPEQAKEPAYVWNNALNGRPCSLASGTPHIREGVNFFNGTPRPGYVPYKYPHPLTARQ